MVTRDGLSCPVGHYAINPVPRTAIFREAALARREAGMPELPLRIEISIPSGRELAEKTFNPHLGIIGGISVLGTTGIVNPMSEAALVETIRLDIRVHAQKDVSLLAVAPGNYGERFLKEETGLSMENFIKCSNFIGTSFKMLSQEGIHQALLAGHVGKLVKVAGGVMNTHSRYGDRRMEILSACARTVGFPEADALLPMNTTEEAADFLYEHGYLKQVMEQVAYYKRNAMVIYEGLKEAGYTVFGGINSPYIWLKVEDGMDSWEFFDYLLEQANVVGTPGSGFGPSGEGYFRLTAFGTYENTVEAVKRIKALRR